MPFFLVTGTPRSRTAWMARFLSYGDVTCEHEPSVQFRGLDDLTEYVSRPDGGASDAMLALLWREITAAAPETRFAVIYRPVDEVIASAERIGLYNPDSRRTIARIMEACSHLMAERPDTLFLRYAELDTYLGCASLFRHCLGVPMPDRWWERWKGEHIECDVWARVHEAVANREGLRSLYGERVR